MILADILNGMFDTWWFIDNLSQYLYILELSSIIDESTVLRHVGIVVDCLVVLSRTVTIHMSSGVGGD